MEPPPAERKVALSSVLHESIPKRGSVTSEGEKNGHRPFTTGQAAGTMLQLATRQPPVQWAVFKLGGVALGVIVLFAGMLGRLEGMSLIWPASPLLLLWLVEAGYAAEQKRCTDFLREHHGNESTEVLPAESASACILEFVRAAMSLSIWPFHVGLLGLVVAGAFFMPVSKAPALPAPAGVPGSVASRPGQSYPSLPAATSRQSAPNQFVPQRSPGYPLPAVTQGNPALPGNGAPALPQPGPAIQRTFNPAPQFTPAPFLPDPARKRP